MLKMIILNQRKALQSRLQNRIVISWKKPKVKKQLIGGWYLAWQVVALYSSNHLNCFNPQEFGPCFFFSSLACGVKKLMCLRIKGLKPSE